MSSAQTQFAARCAIRRSGGTVGAQHQAAGTTQLAYRIADISFAMTARDGLRMVLEPSLREFALPRAASDGCDVNVSVSLVDALSVPPGKPLFESGGLWSLFAENGGYRLNFLRAFPGETPYKSAWFDRYFRKGELSLSRHFFNTEAAIYPLEYPLDEVLMIHYLAGGKGLEVHALGVVDDAGGGHLFLGHSGAGKSTSARLWLGQKGMRILSDDRIILRRSGEQVWMHGTPWHGDAGIASPDSARLTHIYVLEQWPSNELVAMPRSVATAEIFARSFVPRHCPEALNFALHFIEQLAQEFPCDVFRFVANRSAVEAIRHAR
ncbi:MAG: hypothetical protein ABSG16_05500 [Candidatus Acidiferrum sp.]